MARIRVGAATEVELKDKKLRYEDAVNSVKNALKFGVLPGMWTDVCVCSGGGGECSVVPVVSTAHIHRR